MCYVVLPGNFDNVIDDCIVLNAIITHGKIENDNFVKWETTLSEPITLVLEFDM